MSTAGLLPRRWRETPEAEAFAEAIAHVLDTPPLIARSDGLAFLARIGTADVLPFLAALKSLWWRIGRGRFAVIGDSSLTGEDRTILAHHLDDPEFIADAPHALPAGLPWAAIEAALARRRGEYWLVLSPALVPTGDLPELATAIAANRSLALAAHPGALLGFSAGGPGPLDPTRFLAALQGDDDPAAQQSLLLAREAGPVILPREAALAHYPGSMRFGAQCRAASCAAIAALG